MKNTMSIDEFKQFLAENREKVNLISPKKGTISKDDPWIKETEWDDLFEEVKKKNVCI